MHRSHRLVALAGILVLLLAACGPAATPAPTATPQPTPTSAPTGPATPTPTRALPTATPASAPKPAAVTPRTGGKLRVVTGVPSGFTLDPHAMPNPFMEAAHVFDSLLELDFDLRVRPGLAESWASPDSTTLVFKLRQGVVFHDGSPFNAQVAKWNFERVLNPATVSPVARQSLAAVDKIETPDNSTLQLKLKNPAADLLFSIGLGMLAMVAPASVEKWGKDVGAHPVGTGAFIFQDWVPDRSIRLTRNPSYWDSPRPYVNEMETLPAKEASTILAAILTGLVDMAGVSLPEHLERLEKTPGIKVLAAGGITTRGLFFNTLKPPMDNLDFRKAVDLAVDREAIVKFLFRGRGEPANSLIAPAFAERNTALPIVQRDLARAKELLARSGYKGQVLDFGCQSPDINVKLCSAVQAQLKEIGINTQVTIYAAGYGQVLGQLLYDIGELQSPHIPADTRAMIYVHSGGRLNSKRFGDTPAARKLDQLIDEIRVTYDWNTRKRLFDELQQVIYDNALDLYFMWAAEEWAARDRVQNFRVFPGTSERLHEVWVKD